MEIDLGKAFVPLSVWRPSLLVSSKDHVAATEHHYRLWIFVLSALYEILKKLPAKAWHSDDARKFELRGVGKDKDQRLFINYLHTPEFEEYSLDFSWGVGQIPYRKSFVVHVLDGEFVLGAGALYRPCRMLVDLWEKIYKQCVPAPLPQAA